MANRGTQKASKKIIHNTVADYSNKELAKGQSTERRTPGQINAMDAHLSAKGPRKIKRKK